MVLLLWWRSCRSGGWAAEGEDHQRPRYRCPGWGCHSLRHRVLWLGPQAAVEGHQAAQRKGMWTKLDQIEFLSWRTHEILHLCQNNLVQLNEPLTVYYIIFFAWKNVECVKCASFFPRVSLLFSKPSATWSHWWTLSTPTTTPGRWCWSWSESSSLPTRRWRRSCWRWTNSELPQTLGV